VCGEKTISYKKNKKIKNRGKSQTDKKRGLTQADIHLVNG
jgi:hypothetical protein